ncbi:MAG: hypothetical protein ACTSSA_09785 [Candidatus Freyarchaeota archaeon]
MGSPRSGGTKHRSFVKLLVRTIMSATSVREKDVTFIADEGFNALSGPKEVVRRETTSLYPTTATP